MTVATGCRQKSDKLIFRQKSDKLKTFKVSPLDKSRYVPGVPIASSTRLYKTLACGAINLTFLYQKYIIDLFGLIINSHIRTIV